MSLKDLPKPGPDGFTVIITPPSFDHVLMGYAPDQWLVGIKTVRRGSQFGLVFGSITEPSDGFVYACKAYLRDVLEDNGVHQ